MKDAWERFAQMDFSTWLSVLVLAVSATLVRLLIEAERLTIRGVVVGSFMAAFLAYVTALYCLEIGMSERMMGVTVGIVTYQALNILTGIAKLGAGFAKNPAEFLFNLRKGK
jgi:hypothetical protein